MVLLGLLAPILLPLALIANYCLLTYIGFGISNKHFSKTNTLITNATATTERLQRSMTISLSDLPEEALPNSTSPIFATSPWVETILTALNDEFNIVYKVLASSPFFAILLGIILLVFTFLTFLSISILHSFHENAARDKKKEEMLFQHLRNIERRENATQARLDDMITAAASQREDIDNLHKDLEEALTAVTQLSESRFLEREEVTQREEGLKSGLEEMKNRLIIAERAVVEVISRLKVLSDDHVKVKQGLVSRLAETDNRIQELATSPLAHRTPRSFRTEAPSTPFTPTRTSFGLRSVRTLGDLRHSSNHFRRRSDESMELPVLPEVDNDSGDENTSTLVDNASPGSTFTQDGNKKTQEEQKEEKRRDISILGDSEDGMRALEFSEETSRILAQIENSENAHLLTPPTGNSRNGSVSDDTDFETF
ncbi:hypothetical protein BJ508DRAFT_375287 [Ascobolus immersus RN42]|uniref:Uncharacterized protein n=1 Tax=Ascobolus immersus RN42 TaxID=1160509 RepID=A0A3N4IFY4_ASCIM|nr:hypothetical protein BJ508DRAFT_375287 [Ascobolus immersus RN42]